MTIKTQSGKLAYLFPYMEESVRKLRTLGKIRDTCKLPWHNVT